MITWIECPAPEQSLIGCPILRGLKHLTIDLELELDDSDDSDDGGLPVTYGAPACRGITAVCLALAGASQMEQLTVRVTVIDSQASGADLAKILWPLIFLRSDIVVRVEGISGVLQRETSAEYAKRARQRALLSHRKKTSFAGLIAEVRKQCAENDRYDNNIIELLDKLSSLGVWVDLTDILTPTSKWTTLQRNADAFEGLNVPRRGHSGLRELSRTWTT